MDIFKDERNHTQGGTKHINKPTTHEERTQGIAPFLFVCTSEREKATPATKTKQERQEDKPKSNKGKAPKAGQKDKTKGKKDKKEGKHATSL